MLKSMIFSTTLNCFFYRFGSVAHWSDVGFLLADFSRSLPDLWLTCDRFVGKVSAMGQPTRPTQPSILQGSVNEYIQEIFSPLLFTTKVFNSFIFCCVKRHGNIVRWFCSSNV